VIYHQVYKLWLLKLLSDYGNFKEAANHARMTQSAVSQNLTALEKALKVSLVIRDRGGIRLTEEGESLLKQVTPVLDILGEVDPSNSDQPSFQGRIRIGAYESIAVPFFRYLYETLEVKQPDLKIEVVTGRSHNLIEKIRKGHIDMAFTINAKPESRLKVESIAKEGLGLYSSLKPGVFFEKAQKNKDVLIKIAAMAPSAQEGYPLFYKRFLKQIPYAHKVAMQSDSLETIRAVAEETSLAAVLPHRVAQRGKGNLNCLWPESNLDNTLGEHKITFVYRDNIEDGMAMGLRI